MTDVDQRPLLGIQISNDNPHDAAAQIARFGIETTCLHLPWGVVETAPRRYDWAALDHWNTIRELVGTPPTPVWFLFPIHMNARGHLPEHLATTPLDSPEFLTAWDEWVAATAPRAGWDETEAIVVIGNELDLFVDSHPDEYEAAVTFLRGATESVKRHAPRARTVNTVTWDSLNKAGGRELFEALNVGTDVVGFTWYDLSGVSVTKPPTSIDETLSAMEAVAAGKPVLLQEIAMPTSPACDGDEELQAVRVDELFDAAETRTRARVAAVIWLTIADWPVEPLREWVSNQFGGALDGNEQFLGFLTSMGLVRSDGVDKPAAKVWQERISRYRSSSLG